MFARPLHPHCCAALAHAQQRSAGSPRGAGGAAARLGCGARSGAEGPAVRVSPPPSKVRSSNAARRRSVGGAEFRRFSHLTRQPHAARGALPTSRQQRPSWPAARTLNIQWTPRWIQLS
eukprot:6213916-Pleurochrysis_carterae.AAC.2